MLGGHILRQKTHQAVIVTLKSGETFRGVLFDKDRHGLELRTAGLVEARSDAQFVAADGSLFLRWENVAYCQFP